MKELFEKLNKSESWFIKVKIPGTTNKYIWISRIEWSKNYQISIFEEKMDLNMIDKWYKETLDKDTFENKINIAITLFNIAKKNKIKSINDIEHLWNSGGKLFYSFNYWEEVSFINDVNLKVKTHLWKLFNNDGKILRDDIIELSYINERWVSDVLIFLNNTPTRWVIDVQWKFTKK